MHIDATLIKYRDDTRDLVVPGPRNDTINFCINHLLASAKEAIESRKLFTIALSGGSTPKAIFHGLAQSEDRKEIDWTRVLVFWSDERAVPPEHPDSNYHMAMTAGMEQLPIPSDNIFRMHAEDSVDANALAYEQLIKQKVPGGTFDLIMLGMGDDGHTASLFPGTQALSSKGRLVVGNYIPQKDTWRMTFTFDCINAARQRCLYVLGKDKAPMLAEVFFNPERHLPSQQVGTPQHRALWIADEAAAAAVLAKL